MTSNLGKRTKDITNQTFGSLTAIKLSHIRKNQAYWVYNCKCGKEHIARANTISYIAKRNDPELPSCGCIELARKTKHGFRKANNTHPTYRAYRRIMSSCYDTKCAHYKWYGAKGVTICDEWKNNPKAFVEWSINNGWSKGLHIDKDILCKAKGINPPVYSPETCQWVTPQVNVSEATNRKNYGKHPNIRLSQEQVNTLLKLYHEGYSVKTLQSMFGLKSNSSVYRLIKLESKGID